MSKKTTALDAALEKISKKHGAKALVRATEIVDPGVMTTPFPSVNGLIKGIPVGRFTCIAGPQHTGKGAFCAQLVAHQQAQDKNLTVLWSDFENALDLVWLERLGVDMSRLIVQKYSSDAVTMEKSLDIALEVLKSQTIGLWIIDSVGAMLPKADVQNSKGEDRSLEEANMLNLQRKLGEFFRKANVTISPDTATGYKGCATILIGQVYTVPSANVSLEEVRGGNALKHWAHLRLLFRRGPRDEGPEEITIQGLDGKPKKLRPGWACRIKVDKTRLNEKESQDVLLPFFYGRGFDTALSTVGAALGLGVITRTGAYYNCAALKEKVQGKDNLILAFAKNPEALKALADLVDQAAAKVTLDEIKTTDQNIEDTNE